MHWNKLSNDDIEEILEDKLYNNSKTNLKKLEDILTNTINKIRGNNSEKT